jgi:glycosyltransferase involved in cell wall biosynthesis
MPVRIAFVSVSAQMGGSEVVLLEIVRGLRRTRPAWDLHLVAPGAGPLLQAVRLEGAGGVVVDMPDPLATFGETAAVRRGPTLPLRIARAAAVVPRYRRAMHAALDRIGSDVVHTNGLKAHLVAGSAGAARAVVWHVHEYVSRRPLTRALLRRFAGRCDAVVANSQSVADDARRALDGPDVRVIPNGVDLQVFSPEGASVDLDALCGFGPAQAGTVRVGLVATFARWKGHAVFLQAIATAAASGVPLRAYIVGGPVYDTRGSQHSLDELTSLARELRIEDRVGFTGFVHEPARALRALDVVVHASTDPEPFGMVVAEAMACGRALVTSATGGAAELVRDGVDALTHPPGDSRHLATCLARLAADSALRRRLGEQARIAAVERFDARRMTDQFARMYEELAARRGRR